jgi:hypothetical protein
MAIFKTLEFCVATVVVLDACTIAVFGRYIADEVRHFGWNRFRLQAAISIAARSAGNLLLFSWFWYYLEIRPDGAGEWFRAHPVPALAGLAVLAVGALWKIRVFTSQECGHASWICSGLAAFTIAGVLALT